MKRPRFTEKDLKRSSCRQPTIDGSIPDPSHWGLTRARAADAAALVVDLETENWRAFCVEGNVKSTTLAKYNARLATLGAFASAIGMTGVTEHVFWKFTYVLFALEYSASTLEEFRSAMALDQKRSSLLSTEWWTQKLEFRIAFSGLKRRLAARFSTPRGPITRDLLLQLMLRLDKLYAIGCLVAYHGLLRHSELVTMRVRDVRQRTEGTVWIAVFGGKARLQHNMDWVDVTETGDVLQNFIAHKQAEDVVFPMWDPEKINRMIQRIAMDLNWDPTLLWVFHGLRHGKAVDLKAEGTPEKTLKVKGRWRSSTHELYQAFPWKGGEDT